MSIITPDDFVSMETRDDGPTSPTETPTPPAPTPSPPPATEEVPERPEARPRRLTGTLSIDSTPWSRVHLGRRSLGTTPILDRVVPAGTHTITLENPERGLRRTVRVRVEAGAHVRRRVTLASTPEG